MQFKDYLQSSVQQIDEALFRVLDSWQEKIGNEQKDVLPLLHSFIDQCRGGKRIRGTLVKLGYDLADGRNAGAILSPAVAFEIFNTAILAHDDIIDKSELRRGKASLYQALGGDHYGISQTISLGDLGFFLATELIATSDFPGDRRNKAVVLFTRIMQKTAIGEMYDVFLPTKKSFNDADVITIARLKTAAYSLIGPLSLGAILAGAEEHLLEKIAVFGENLGIAYQIYDDILGIFGNEKEIGKSTTSDIREGKSTLLVWYALHHSSPTDKKIIESMYGNENITEDDGEHIKILFKKTGAYEYAVERVKTYTNNAREHIQELTENAQMDTLLHDFTNFLLERRK